MTLKGMGQSSTPAGWSMYLQSAPCTGGVEKKRVSARLYLPSLQAAWANHCLCRYRLAVQVAGAKTSLPRHHSTACKHRCA